MRISRRKFVQSSAAALGLFGSRMKTWAASSQQVDALVIGSGFGGSIAALRLAEAGIHTVVLERGKRWPITAAGDTFCTFQNPDGRSSWLSSTSNGIAPIYNIDVYTGVLELINANGIVVRAGAGVGGGSLVYNAILLKPRKELFEQVFPSAISYREMSEIYYPRVKSIIKMSPIPQDILNSSYYLSTRVNLQNAQAAGFTTRLVDYGVDWNIVRQEIAGTKVPSAIDGQSWYGLSSGAKTSVDHNYLKLAEDTGRVDVLPLHVVTDIGQDPSSGLYMVSVNQIDTTGAVLQHKLFVTKHLFLGAGSVGTSSLMAKAKAKGTLPKLNEYAGKGWGSNGDFIVFRGGLGGGNDNAGQGGPCGHILMEDLKNAYSPSDLVELVVPKNAAFPGASLYVGLGVAPPVGYFTYDKTSDSAMLNWPADSSELTPANKGAASMCDTLNAANPGTFNAFFSTTLTAHPVGGMNAGTACDYYGRVARYKGLYVVDGAQVPGGSVGGVNPSWTIAALAERSMDNILAQDLFR